MHALVLEGGASSDRDKSVGDGLPADRSLQILLSDRLLLQEEHADFFIKIAHLLDKVLVRLLCKRPLVGWDLDDLVGGTELIIVRINDGFLIEHIDLAPEVIFLAQRDQDRPRIGAKLLAHAVHRRVEIRSYAVHLVNEGNPGHPVFAGLPPDRFRLRLDPCDTAEYSDGAVENTKGTLHLGREVDVPGRVDNVHSLLNAFEDLVNVLFFALHPRAGGRCGSDRDTTLALLLHPIRDGGSFVDLANLVDHACIKQDAFGESGLPRIDMRGDPDVARAL